MAEEFLAEGDARLAPLPADPVAFFDTVDRFAEGRDLPADRVPQSWFLLRVGGSAVGCSRLRHRLIPVLHRDGGNIGYEVRPSERGRGHGTRILGLTLAEARRLGLDRVLLTTEESNTASIRVIERNGGTPDGTSVSPNTGRTMLRYWIDLAR